MIACEAALRPISAEGLSAVAAVHLAAFEGFYLSALGDRFLREDYARLLEYRGGILVGAFSGEDLVGFVAGFVAPDDFYRTLKRQRIRLVIASLPALARRPSRIMAFIANYRRVRRLVCTPAGQRTTAELCSLAVRPKSAGRGIGKRLVREFCVVASRLGADQVILTTDADDNVRVNAFYEAMGFKSRRAFEARPGRMLNDKHHDHCPKV